MTRCELDKSIKRRRSGDLAFPLGVYPIEQMTAVQGYSVEFEQADAGAGDEWEEWPDRYVFEAVITAERLRALCRSLISLLPLRVFPILDVMGHDAYREIDPYIAYDPVGLDRFLDGVQRYAEFLYEDGLVGFGALSDEPFCYFFLDEHKVVTVRCTPDQREAVEATFRAFDLVQVTQPAGADAVAHEHRGVLFAPEDKPDLLIAEEIVERLVEDWQLTLNIDMESNVDDDGRELGVSRWRCIVRALGDDERATYVEIVLHASNYRRAEDLAVSRATDELVAQEATFESVVCISADRLTPEQETELLSRIAEQQAEGELLPGLANPTESAQGNPQNGIVDGHVVLARVLGSE